MDDRNKTELTQNITRNVALWLDVRRLQACRDGGRRRPGMGRRRGWRLLPNPDGAD